MQGRRRGPYPVPPYHRGTTDVSFHAAVSSIVLASLREGFPTWEPWEPWPLGKTVVKGRMTSHGSSVSPMNGLCTLAPEKRDRSWKRCQNAHAHAGYQVNIKIPETLPKNPKKAYLCDVCREATRKDAKQFFYAHARTCDPKTPPTTG